MNAINFYMYRHDAVEFLRGLPTASVDCIITDVAYESLEKHRAKGTTTRLKVSKSSSNEWFDIFPDSRWPDLFDAFKHALKPNGHIYSVSDQTTARFTSTLAEAKGLAWWKWITWDKQRIGMGYHYRNRTEVISFFEKGKRRLNDLGLSDVIVADDLDNGELGVDKLDVRMVTGGYPTEKPVELALPLVLQSTNPGEVVCDPFGGSGAFCRAAIRCGRVAYYNDLSPAAHDYAMPRLSAELADYGKRTVPYSLADLKLDMERRVRR